MLRNMAEELSTPEGRLIREEIDKAGLSVRSVAREVPISDTQLRAWYRGYDSRKQEVNFPARQLARVAQVLNLRSEQLREVGRDDAADALDRMTRAVEPTRTYTPEEMARLLQGMAKRLGEIEDENQELRERIDEIEGGGIS